MLLLVSQGVRVKFNARHRKALPAIGVLVGVQSLCLYSAVARLPVALALLAFNTYPIWTAVWSAVVYRKHPEKAMLVAMPVILVGLALALDVFGAASGLGASSITVAAPLAGASPFGGLPDEGGWDMECALSTGKTAGGSAGDEIWEAAPSDGLCGNSSVTSSPRAIAALAEYTLVPASALAASCAVG